LSAFGEKLRKQREHRGITLEAVANTTKISTRMLKALEDEHFDQLPGGVFNKGFVRAYARQVGLNEEEAINDYLAALAECQLHSQAITPNLRGASQRPARENQPPSIPVPDLPRAPAPPDRRLHTERRVEARRTQDRLSGALRAGEALRQERLAGGAANYDRANEDRTITDYPIQPRPREDASHNDPENDSRFKPAFIPKSNDRVTDPVESSARVEALPSLTKFDRDQNPRFEGSHPSEGRPEADQPEKIRAEEHQPEEHRPEENSYDELPAGVPSFLNLNGAPQPYEEPEQLPPVPVVRRSPSKPVPWGRLALPLILFAIVVLFVVFLRRNYSAPQVKEVSQPATPSQPLAAPTTPPALASATVPAGRSNASAANTSNSTVPTSSPSPQSSIEKPAPAEPPSDVTTIIPPRAHPSTPKPPAAFTLIIRATENSLVAITADGQSVAQENLIAPAATSVRATKEVVVRVGNAAGVSFMLNGKDITPSGVEGQPQTYIFDADGLRNSAPGSATNPTR
jgi:cytoskeletal protein RodZ